MAVSKTSAQSSERPSKRRKLSTSSEPPEKTASKKPKSLTAAAKEENSTNSVSQQPHSPSANPDLPAVKGLDSSEPHIRRTTLRSILDHLRSRRATSCLTTTQCLQIWRGFFVVIYMHDSKNMISVQNLLGDLAGTFATVSEKDDELGNDPAIGGSENWLTNYHAAFQETLVREWAGVDSHRMNKYLLLVRFVLRELFTICLRPLVSSAREGDSKVKPRSKASKQSNSDVEKPKAARDHAISKTRSVLQGLEALGPLNPSDRKIPDGLRLHTLDIWIDELFGAVGSLGFVKPSEQDPTSEKKEATLLESLKEVLLQFRAPIDRVSNSASGAQRQVRMRAKETLQSFDEHFQEL